MGNTTIIELNNDLKYEIEKDPKAFVDSILCALNSGASDDIPAGKFIACFSRYDRINDQWERFKKTMHWTRKDF